MHGVTSAIKKTYSRLVITKLTFELVSIVILFNSQSIEKNKQEELTTLFDGILSLRHKHKR